MAKIVDFHIHPPGPGGMSAQEQDEMAAYGATLASPPNGHEREGAAT